jgi:hypothetical protein
VRGAYVTQATTKAEPNIKQAASAKPRSR